MAELPFHPMIGNLIALLQLGGTVVFGRLIVDKLLEKTGWLLQLAVGMIVISQAAYIVTFFPDYFWVLKLMAWGLVCGGCILIGKLLFHKIFDYEVLRPKNFLAWLAALLSLSYLLLALGPPTQADALDYHWGVPMYLMRHYHWPPHRNLAYRKFGRNWGNVYFAWNASTCRESQYIAASG